MLVKALLDFCTKVLAARGPPPAPAAVDGAGAAARPLEPPAGVAPEAAIAPADRTDAAGAAGVFSSEGDVGSRPLAAV
eukprot:10184866-Alexandrium_andersonii.AAC.1